MVIPNAPPLARFRELARPHRPTMNAALRLGYVGVMGSQEGLDLLLRALAILAARRPDLRVEADLVGDGEARRGLEILCADLGLEDRVQFHGYQRDEVFVPILARAHVGVSPDPPTPFNHLCTMAKVVDYLAIGRPVVSFDLAGTRYLTGDAGIAADPATPEGMARAIERLASEPDLLDSLTRAADDRLERLEWSWERSERRLLAAYRSLLARQQARPAGADVASRRVAGD